MNKKILLAATTVLAFWATATFATNVSNDKSELNDKVNGMHRMHGKEMKWPMMMQEKWKMMSPEIKAALEANDYTAFVSAFTSMIANRTAPTQEEFATMVTKAKEMESKKELKKESKDEKHTAIETAIKENNYDAFVQALQAKTGENPKMKKTPSKEEFAMMVSNYPKMLEQRAQHENMKAAVLANDYTAFVKAFEANKPTVPTQEEFNKMREMHSSMSKTKELKKEMQQTKKSKKQLKRIIKKSQ